MSIADQNYQKLIRRVLETGWSNEGQQVRTKWQDGTPAYTKAVFFESAVYDLSQEFPIHTLRPTAFKSCIEEILWIWQKKSNNIHDLRPKIWDQWADEEGSIGKAYGYQLRQKHDYKDGKYDQVDRILSYLKNDPCNRGMLTNLYNHAELNEMRLRPCVYGCNFDVAEDRLNLLVNQRSADLITAGGWNLTQYAVLAHMFAQASGLKPGILAYVIANAHVYDRHMDFAKDLATRPTYPAPKFTIDTDVKDFYSFTPDSFKLENYQTGPQIKDIPVAI